MTTLAEWTNTVVTGVVSGLPLQDSASALSLTQSYITNAGGWIPDSGLDPTGPGHLSGNISTGTAISAIVADEYSRVYETTANLSLNLTFRTVNRLTPNLSEDNIRAAMVHYVMQLPGI